jgi:hypothetical protein
MADSLWCSCFVKKILLGLMHCLQMNVQNSLILVDPSVVSQEAMDKSGHISGFKLW